MLGEPLSFTFAISSYDHIQPVVDGAIPITGAAPLFIRLPIPEMFRRFVKAQEWDVSEVSFVKYVTMRAAGDDRISAIPVFPSREYRQSAIYVNSSVISTPEDLIGTRIGIPEWTNSAGVWGRGLLADMHSIDAASITWYQGGIDRPGRAVVLDAPHLPADIEIVPVTARSLEEMLWSGDLEAVIVPTPPPSIATSAATGGLIRRLYADPVAAEKAYWEKTNCLPTMHVVALAKRLTDRAPDIGVRIYQALDASRARYFERLQDEQVSRVPLPWIQEHLASVSGPAGPWPYGIEPNVATIECLLRYARTQGLIDSMIAPADLFPDWNPHELEESVRVP